MSTCHVSTEYKRHNISSSVSIRLSSSSSLRMPILLRKQWLKRLELMGSLARKGISSDGSLVRLRIFSVQAGPVERRLPINLFRICLQNRQTSTTANENLNQRKKTR